jgi:hypothetical protein
MAIKAGDIFISLRADFAQFRDDLVKIGGELAGHVGEMKSSLEGLNSAFETLNKGLGGIAEIVGVGAILEAGKQLADFAVESLSAVDALAKTAEEAGLTTAQYQGLQYAATQSSTSQETLNSGLTRLVRTIGQAAEGGKAQQRAFVDLGVSFLDASGKARDTHAVLLDVADALGKLPTQAQRAREEVALFGRSGQEMDAFMRQGSSGIEEMEGKAKSLGLVLGTEEVEAAKRASSEIEGLRLNWERLTEHIVIAAAPALEKFIGLLARLTNPMPVYRDQLAAIDKQIEGAKEALKADEAVANGWLGGWLPSGLAYAQKHLADLEKQASELRLMFEDVTGEAGARGLSPATPPPLPPAVTGGTTRETQAQKDAAAFARVKDALTAEIAALTGDSEATKLNTALREAHAKAGSEEAAEIHSLVDEIARDTKAKADAKKAKEDDNKLTQEAQKIIESILTPQQKYNKEIEDLTKLLAAGKINYDQFNLAAKKSMDQMNAADPALKQQAEDTKKLQDEVNKLADDMGTELANAFLSSASAADKWKALATTAIKDVMNILEQLLNKALGGSTDSGLSGIFGSLLTSVFGGGSFASGAIGASAPLPGSPLMMAGGGHLGIGDWAIVGEAGPELVYADTPGNIMSAERTRGVFGSGGGGNTAYIDARGADPAGLARVENALRELHYSIESRAVAAVSAQRKRGGTFTATFER